MLTCAACKLQQQSKADDDMDALFGESSGDEDYDPTAPEPDAVAAPAAAGGPQQQEEADYASDSDAEREALAEATSCIQRLFQLDDVHNSLEICLAAMLTAGRVQRVHSLMLCAVQSNS